MDLSGQRYGRLVVLGPTESINGQWSWFCRCDCGNEREVRARHLRSGRTNQCKACALAGLSETFSQHGARRGLHSDTYRVWVGIRTRCRNPNASNYGLYGGRGIRVCDEWNDFSRFLADMGPRPSPLHSIDRIDPDGDYVAENCRWATPEIQSGNRRVCYQVTHEGAVMALAAFARKVGVPKDTLRYRAVSRGLGRIIEGAMLL